MRFLVRDILIDDDEDSTAGREIYKQQLEIVLPERLEHVKGTPIEADVLDWLVDETSNMIGWCIVSCTVEEDANDGGYPSDGYPTE